MNLRDILYKVTLNAVVGNTDVSINNLEFDSRKVSLNDCFVAIKGIASDGHEFIKMAVNQGALAVICDVIPEKIINGITYIQVEDSKEALAIMASNYFGNPSEKLSLIGITG
ncbi:MAG: UDP-N-acetylmuramoyl-L-alanyl-D-glutamate--2,6-diaminopimelate ligase, partial [Flavobacteriaceae bacterium CG_4_9_14_0_8_um_filter_34_30]